MGLEVNSIAVFNQPFLRMVVIADENKRTFHEKFKSSAKCSHANYYLNLAEGKYFIYW